MTKRLTKGTNKFVLSHLGIEYTGRPQVDGSSHADEATSGTALRPDRISRAEASGMPVYVQPTLMELAHCVHRDSVTGHKIFVGPKHAADLSNAKIREALQETNVVGIVRCTTVPSQLQTRPLSQSQAQASLMNRDEGDSSNYFPICHVPVNDVSSADILSYLEGATTFMHALLAEPSTKQSTSAVNSSQCPSNMDAPAKTHGSVLVHCEMGVSRSATVAIAYLMRYNSLARDEAYLVVKRRRPKINPNEGFWKQLEQFELACQTNAADGIGNSSNQNTHECVRNHGAMGDASVFEAASNPADTVCDKAWFLKANALYCTCRELPNVFESSQYCHALRIFRDADSTGETELSRFLCLCLDMVWGRGLMDVDLDFMCAACLIIDEANKTTNGFNFGRRSCRDIVLRDLLLLPSETIGRARSSVGHDSDSDGGGDSNERLPSERSPPPVPVPVSPSSASSDFLEIWAGEVYPHQIAKVVTAFHARR